MNLRMGEGMRGARLGTGRHVAWVLDRSAKARRSVLALVAVLAYVLIGQVFAPGFIENWGYYAVQTAVVLAAVLALEVAFHEEGGLAWQTHLIVVAMVIADTIGTASDLYHTFDLFDKWVHFASAAAFAATAYDVLTAFAVRGALRLAPAWRFLIAVLVSFAVAGIAWEIYEHWGDVVFNTDRVQSRTDTTHDLISNICGAVLAGSLLWVRDTTVRSPARERVM
jgi:hypothetical protein